MHSHPFILETDLFGKEVESKEEATRFVKKNIDEGTLYDPYLICIAKHRLRDLETERDAIQVEKKRLSSTTQDSVSKGMEEEEVFSPILPFHLESARITNARSKEEEGGEGRRSESLTEGGGVSLLHTRVPSRQSRSPHIWIGREDHHRRTAAK